MATISRSVRADEIIVLFLSEDFFISLKTFSSSWHESACDVAIARQPRAGNATTELQTCCEQRRDLFFRRQHIVDAFFSALTISTISTPGSSMRQSLAASFFLNCVPAAAVGLMLMPPLTAAAAAPEPSSAKQVEAAPPDTKVTEPNENEAPNNDQCVADQPCSTKPDVVSEERAYLIKTATPGGT